MEKMVAVLLKLFDDAMRPRLRRAIKDLDRLEADPIGYLAERGGVWIRPRVSWVMMAMVIFLCYIMMSMMIIFLCVFIESKTGKPVKDTVVVQVIVASLYLICIFSIPVVVWKKMRGATLCLVESGIMFSRNGIDILCPWDVLDPTRQIVFVDDDWLELPVDPSKSTRIALLTKGTLVTTGSRVWTNYVKSSSTLMPRNFFSQLSPVESDIPPVFLLVKDSYAVKGEELFPFILRISARLATNVKDVTQF